MYLPLRLRVERSGRYVETLVKDISMGGLRCLISDYPAVNESVSLELPLYKEVMPLRVNATVAWVHPAGSEHQYLVGLNFRELPPAARHALTDYLERVPAAFASSN